MLGRTPYGLRCLGGEGRHSLDITTACVIMPPKQIARECNDQQLNLMVVSQLGEDCEVVFLRRASQEARRGM